MAIINGYSYGKAVINTSGDIPEIITVELPLTNYGGGLKDITGLRGNTYETINMDLSNKIVNLNQSPIGFQLAWEFYYGDFITGTNLYNKFYPILKAWYNQWQIRLYPRIDVDRSFLVKLVSENLTLGLKKGGSNAKYHSGALFTFQAVDTQPDPQWFLVPEPDTSFRVYINEFQYS